MQLAERKRWWIRRHPLLSVAILSFVVCMAFFGVFVAKLTVDWPAQGASVPRVVANAAAGKPELVGKVFVYDCWGALLDSEHLWRVKVDESLIPAIMVNTGSTEVVAAAIPSAFWWHTPYWWQPPRSGAVRYFVSPDFRADERNGDGEHYMMIYDQANGLLYVWNKSNF
jgi:hypothetical protein